MGKISDIEIVEKDWMPEDTFALVTERLSKQYDIPPMIKSKTKKESWLKRKVSLYRFKKALVEKRMR